MTTPAFDHFSWCASLLFGLVLVAGCGADLYEPGDGSTSLPELPDLSLASPAAADRLARGHQRAIDLLTAGDEIEPRVVGRALGDIGMLLHAHDLLKQSVAWYEAAADHDPTNARWPHYLGVLAWHEGHLEAADRYFAWASKTAPAEVGPLLWQARIALTRGTHDAAESLLLEAQNLDETPYALFSLAIVRMEQGEPRAAVSLLERVRTLVPGTSDVTHALARARAARGDDTGARQALSALAPGDRDGSRLPLPDRWMDDLDGLTDGARQHEQRGHRFLRAGQHAAAAAEFRQALILDPTRHRLRHNLASLLLGLGQREQAIAQLWRVVEAHPQQAQSWILLASLHEDAGELDLAEGRLRTAVGEDPGSALAHAALGELLHRQDRCDVALTSLETALLLDPRQEKAFGAMVLCLERTGDAETARLTLDRALATFPDSNRFSDLAARLGPLASRTQPEPQQHPARDQG